MDDTTAATRAVGEHLAVLRLTAAVIQQGLDELGQMIVADPDSVSLELVSEVLDCKRSAGWVSGSLEKLAKSFPTPEPDPPPPAALRTGQPGDDSLTATKIGGITA